MPTFFRNKNRFPLVLFRKRYDKKSDILKFQKHIYFTKQPPINYCINSFNCLELNFNCIKLKQFLYLIISSLNQFVPLIHSILSFNFCFRLKTNEKPFRRKRLFFILRQKILGLATSFPDCNWKNYRIPTLTQDTTVF